MDIKELNCKNCGASISVGAADLQVKCPFCGTQYNTTGTDASNKLAAILQGEKTFLVEAQLDENAVRKSIYNWLGKGFFSPSGFRESIAKVTMITVNISSMAFEARAESRWSGEDSRTETGPNNTQRTIVTRRDGNHAENYLQFANLSAAVTQDELEKLNFKKEDLKPAPAQLNMRIEVPTIASKEDIPRIQELAKGFIEAKERSACASQVGRLLSVSTFVNFIDRYFVFVPAAIYNYEYAGKKYRVVADRKRGTVIGARPVSAIKVTLFVLAILALIAAGVFLFMKYGKAV